MDSNSKVDDNDLQYELLPDDYVNYDLSFKIIIIGDSGINFSLKRGGKVLSYAQSYEKYI